MPDGKEGFQPEVSSPEEESKGAGVAEAYEYAAHAMKPDSAEYGRRADHLMRLVRALNSEATSLEMPEEYPSIEDAYSQYLEAKTSGDTDRIKKATGILIEVASTEAESV